MVMLLLGHMHLEAVFAKEAIVMDDINLSLLYGWVDILALMLFNVCFLVILLINIADIIKRNWIKRNVQPHADKNSHN